MDGPLCVAIRVTSYAFTNKCMVENVWHMKWGY